MFKVRPACLEPCGTYLPEGRFGPVSESSTNRTERAAASRDGVFTALATRPCGL
jgi:hypothetical protein